MKDFPGQQGAGTGKLCLAASRLVVARSLSFSSGDDWVLLGDS